MSDMTDDRRRLNPEEMYVIETVAGPVTLYYRADIDQVIVQGRHGLTVAPRADNSVGLIHEQSRRRN